MGGGWRSRTGAAIVAAVATASVAASAFGAAPASTARGAALARTDAYAKRDTGIKLTTYMLGSCRLLHRRPWLGYVCGYTVHGESDECHDQLTVAVTRTSTGGFIGTAKKWTGSAAGAPC